MHRRFYNYEFKKKEDNLKIKSVIEFKITKLGVDLYKYSATSTEEYKKDLIEEDSLVVTLEAGSITSWQKYIKNKGLNLGIDRFGESAPYKEVYDHFNLTEEKITNFIQKKMRD